MPAAILDGKSIAKQIREEIAADVTKFSDETGVAPALATVLVGDDPASEVYVRNKQRACQKAGMRGVHIPLPAATTQAELLELIKKLNEDDAIHGILVQLPLPDGLNDQPVLDAIHPLKDVDCFHPHNVGLLAQGRGRFFPCTPHGIVQLLHRSGVEAAGKHVVILGRSDIVGKPMAMLLVQRNSPLGPGAANATVTICHSRTPDLPSITRQADILIAAIGRAKFVTAEMIQPGAAVVDVGINRTDEGLVGDVDFASAREVAGHISPVPGGVGPLTIAMLLHNTLTAARVLHNCKSS